MWRREVNKVSHRPYSTGFYFGEPGQYTEDACYFSESDVAAVVTACDEAGNAVLRQRNRFFPGDELELLMPGAAPVTFTAGQITDRDGASVNAANHPDEVLRLRLPLRAPEHSFLRKVRAADLSGHRTEREDTHG